jgi:hypothetical protein
MATTNSIIPLHQPKPAMTGAERARRFRERKREKAKPASELVATAPKPAVTLPILTPTPAVTAVTPVTPVPRHAAPILLTIAALALAVVGVSMNGWFARSLGSTDMAGCLFLAIGVAADLAALALPSAAAQLWQTGKRATSAAGWVIWLVTFTFAVTASIGFASLNITDVTMARAAHVTPAVTMTQVSLTDAMTARDRECAHGVGKWCRERETAVTERRQAVDVAMSAVEQTADPQTTAAVKLVSWVTAGTVRPTGDDFAMLRLMLLALLPQIGGILLMVGRGHRR